MEGLYEFLDVKDEIRLVLDNDKYKKITIVMQTKEYKQFM